MKAFLTILTFLLLTCLITDQIANKLYQNQKIEMIVDSDSSEEESNYKSGRIKSKFKELGILFQVFICNEYSIKATNFYSHLIRYLSFTYSPGAERHLFILFKQLKINL